MTSNTLQRNLTEGNITILLIKFIGPLFLANVLQMVYNLADMAIVGRFVGSEGLSAVSVCGEAIHVLTFLSIGFSNAGQVLIAQYIGAGKQDRVRQTIGNMFTFLLLISLIFMVLSLTFRDYLLRFANIPAEARAYGMDYFVVSLYGLFFTYGYNAASAILRGMGDSQHPFVFVTIASIINIVLDLLFVAVFDMEVFGAALATTLSQAVSFISSVIFLYIHKLQFGFDFKLKSFLLHKSALIPLCRLGIPMALQSGCIQGAKLAVSRWINYYGVTVSAISGIGNKFNSIGLTFAGAVGTSASSMIGQCIGAGKYERVKKIIIRAWVLAVITAAILSAGIYFFPNLTFGIFTEDMRVLQMANEYKPVVVILLFSSAFRAPATGIINGSGHSRLNFILAIVDGLVGHLGLSALFGLLLGYGVHGLWYGNAAAGFIPFFIGVLFFFSGKWMTRKNLVDAVSGHEEKLHKWD